MAIDVIPFGDRQFVIQLFRIAIPDQIGFGRYYEATCEIVLKDGNTIHYECIVKRPSERRNAVGVSITDLLWLSLKTDLTQMQLSDAAISVAQYGAELSEEAEAWQKCAMGRSPRARL